MQANGVVPYSFILVVFGGSASVDIGSYAFYQSEAGSSSTASEEGRKATGWTFYQLASPNCTTNQTELHTTSGEATTTVDYAIYPGAPWSTSSG